MWNNFDKSLLRIKSIFSKKQWSGQVMKYGIKASTNDDISSIDWWNQTKIFQNCTFFISVTFIDFQKTYHTLREEISWVSRILAIFAKIDSFFDSQKCRIAKINSRKIFQNCWFSKINSRKIFQEFMKCEYWSFCPLFFHLFL